VVGGNQAPALITSFVNFARLDRNRLESRAVRHPNQVKMIRNVVAHVVKDDCSIAIGGELPVFPSPGQIAAFGAADYHSDGF